MKRFTLFSMFSKCNSSKKRRSVRRGRKLRGGEGSAADYGVKVWGHDQVADPNKGNVIKANLVTGGAVPFSNDLPKMDSTISTADMSKQALDMQDASINYMITPKVQANINSESVSPKTGGRRKTKRRVSKRKYGHKIRNGRRTKTIY